MTTAAFASAAPRQAIPPFTDDHEEFRDAVRTFVTRELRPHVNEWEAAEWIPEEVFRRVGELGYFGLKFPREYGGDDDPVAAAVFCEEIARCGSGGVGAGLGAHAGIASPPIASFGTPDQKERYLRPAIRGELIGGLAITEPNAGSDVASVRTTARKVGGGYVVNGSKTFITNGIRADWLVTAVRTTAEGGHHGLSFLIIDTNHPGITRNKLSKMGWRASDTAEISFEDVPVPEENLLGPENDGFKLIMANFQWERIMMALGALGAMEWTFERTLRYVRERHAFGRPIGSFQVNRHALAEMETTIETARSLTYHALRLMLDGGDAVNEVTMAKLYTQRAAFELADRCLQLHGGAGYMEEYEIERMVRDARLGPIGGGTDEIMKEILGRRLGL